MTPIEAIDTYINGNIKDAKKWMKDEDYLLSEFLKDYIDYCEPDNDEILRFVRRMES